MTSLWKTDKSTTRTRRATPMEPINELRAQIQQLLTRQTAIENQAARFGRPIQENVRHQDIHTEIQSATKFNSNRIEQYQSLAVIKISIAHGVTKSHAV